jgi:hypothetical protein
MPPVLDDEIKKIARACKGAWPILLGGLQVFLFSLIIYSYVLFLHRDRFSENDCVMLLNDKNVPVYYRISTVHKTHYSANLYMLDQYGWAFWIKYEPVVGKRTINFGQEVDKRLCGYFGERRGGY